ncbi:MAG: hypothetical protein R3E87_20520 [Burkholderiaceae bacterium]
MVKRLASALATILATSLLVACGGGGGGGAGATTAAQQLSGVVVDGYIEGATVCLDINLNNVCDTGERTAVTTVGGAYSLNTDGLDASAVAAAMLIVDIPESAKDSDDNGQTLAQAGKVATRLVAPVVTTTPGRNVISPLTTLVAERMRRAHVTNPVATEWVRSLLGLGPTDQINADFRAETDAATRERLSNVAASLFNLQDYVIRQCEGWIEQGYLSRSDDWYCAVEAIDALLNSVDEDTIIDLAGSQAAQVRAALMSNLLRIFQLRQRLADSSTTTNAMLATDFRTGLNEFRDMGVSLECAADANCANPGYQRDYRIRSMVYADGTLETEDYYAIMEPTFVANGAAPRDYWELKDSQWTPVGAQLQIYLHGDGDFRISGGEFGSTGVAMSARGFDLGGTALNAAGLNRFDANQRFHFGANGYLLGFRTATARYVLSGPPVADQAQNPLTGDLPLAYPSSASPSWTNALATHSGLSMTFGPTVDGAGTVSFRDPDVPNQVLPQLGAYQVLTIAGQTIVKISEIPSQVLSGLELLNPTASADYQRGVRPIFGTAPDGYLREGVYTPVSAAPSPHLYLNRVALNQILQARSLCQVDENYSNISCPN